MSITGSMTLIIILTVGPASGKKATSGTAPGQDGMPADACSQYHHRYNNRANTCNRVFALIDPDIG